MLEQIIKFIRINETFKYFTVLDADGNEMLNYYSSDNNEIIQEISNDFDILEVGKYTIVGRTGKTTGIDSSTTKKFNFSVKSDIQKKQPIKTMDAEYIDKIKKEAYEQGYREAKIERLEQRLNDHIKECADFRKKVADKFDELDGEADNDILGKATEILTPHLGTIVDKLPDFKLS